MSLPPVAMSTAELLEVLGDVVARVRAHDSMDGSLEYHVEGPPCPECSRPDDDSGVLLDPRQDCPVCVGWGDLQLPEGKDFWVSGLYRVGNAEGQGGMRLIRGDR